MMKQLLLGLMLLVTATAASAEWAYAGEGDEFITYVDRTTIRRSRNLVKMWHLSDFKKATVLDGKYALSHRSQYEYDCAEERMRRLAVTTFSGQMGSGAINYNDSDTLKWDPVPPGSMGEIMWKIACGKQ